MISIFGFVFDQFDLLLFITVGMLVGMSKTGISGAGMIAVPILALLFGGKVSSGMMLPILVMADVFGVSYYHRHAQWIHLKKLLPYSMIGILLGTLVGQYINDEVFRMFMAFIIFISLGIMIWLEKKSWSVPTSQTFAITTGIAGGFTTMIGNLAGSVMALYLLVMQMPKNQFIGTAAWFFLIINLSKVPFHVFVWETITWNTVWMDLLLLPSIAVGAFLGIQITKRIPEVWYRYFIILMTLVAAVWMVF